MWPVCLHILDSEATEVIVSVKFLSHGSLSAVKYCNMTKFEFYFLFIYTFFYAPLSCVGCYLFYFLQYVCMLFL